MEHPPRIMSAGLFVCFLFLLVSTSASPDKCSTGCHGMHSGSAYKEGVTYIYQLEGTSVTSVSEAQGEANLQLSAAVELSVKPDCIKQLRLKNVQVNGAQISLRDLEQHALQFNYHDGHIDTEVCAEAGDSQASLNIKRAVISLFQAAIIQESGVSTHYETDVFGGCPTDFSFKKEGDVLEVRKFRNLGRCSHRENIQQELISTTFNANSDIKSSPLLDSEQKIEQVFKLGVLNKAKSTEVYNFKPFSNGESGAKTTVETILTLKGQKQGGTDAPVSMPKSLIFEVPHLVVKSSVDSIANTLDTVLESMREEAKPEAASHFAKFIKVLRTSNKNDILTVYHRVKSGAGYNKERGKKVFLDALFRTGTGEAAEVAVELIKSHEIVGAQALLYYTSLALVRHVNLPSIAAVVTLLDQPNLPRIGYLGIGSLIGKYCQEHNCRNVPEVANALAKIVSKIGNGKTDSRQQEDVVVSALKALGNSRYLDENTQLKVARIAANKLVHNRVRVAAIEALPSACSMKWKSILLDVLADRQEDSEIRIKSYLAVVSCPCPHVANNLKEILDKETINQVGSFISSHLRNLRASANPDKQEAKRQLGLIKPRVKFPEDFRKFSSNDEFSYSLNALGIGSSAETNVIYSQNSFVPRSASLNLTTEIFGHSFNFLQLDGRAENLDRLIEHYFGPKGIISNQDIAGTVLNGWHAAGDISKYIQKRIEKITRSRRSINEATLRKFADNVHLRNNEVDENVDLDLSIKLFGAEVAFLSYQGDSKQWTSEYIIDKIFDALDAGVQKAKDFHYSLENHLHFLDADLIYPTGLGLPLTLGVTGTSVVHLKTNGKLDIPSIIRDPKNAAVQIAVEPSASINVAGTLIIEAFGLESGLKVVSTLHTATGTNVNVKLLGGKGIDVSFGIPKKKQELIGISSEVLLSLGPKGKFESPKFSKGKEHSDCFDQLSGLIGLTLCGHVTYPYDSLESVQKKPLFPLSGPANFGITIENTDVTNYHFRAFYDDQNSKARTLELVLETPNSKTNRKLALLLEGAIEPDKLIKMSVYSPFKKASIEAIIKDNPQERTITVTVLNDQIEYFARAGLLANGNKYKPILEYKVPEHIEKLAGTKSGTKTSQRGGQQYNVQGVVEVNDYEGGKKYVFDRLVLTSPGRKLVGLDGSIIAAPNESGADLKIGYGDESLALKADAKKLGINHYSLSLSAQPLKNPDIGFNINWHYQREKNHIDNKLVFVHGADLNSKTNRLTLQQNLAFNFESINQFDVSGKSKLTYPALPLVLKLEGDATAKSIGYDAEIKYDKFKFESKLSANIGKSKPSEYDVEFEAQIMENSIEFKTKRTILSEHKSKYENVLELRPGGKYEADAEVVYDVKPGSINIQVESDLKLDNKKVKLETGLEANRQVFNSFADVNIDGVKYIDYALKVYRGDPISGEINLSLKNYLTATGKYAYQNHKGNANFNIDIPKINRKIKGTGDLSVTGTRHVANFELLYDAEKDPNKRIKVSTDTDLSKTFVDTKNVIEILTYKTLVNFKSTLQDISSDGLRTVDLDVTLPNGRYIVVKGKREMTRKGNSLDLSVQAELIDHISKGGQARKLIYNVDGKNIDTKTTTADNLKWTIQYIGFDGKDVNVVLGLKHIPNNSEKKLAEIQLDITGSCIPKPFSFDFSADYGKDTAAWKVKSSLGDNPSLKGSGSISHGNNIDRPTNFNAIVEMKLPIDKLRNIKFESTQSLLVPIEIGGTFELTGSSIITYNEDKTIQLNSAFKHIGIIDIEHTSEGSAQINLSVLRNPTLTIGTTYKHDPSKDEKKLSGSFTGTYGERGVVLDADSSWMRESEGHLWKTNANIVADNTKYTINSEIKISEVSPSVAIIFTSPAGKTKVSAKFNKLGDKEFTGEWKIDSPKSSTKSSGGTKTSTFRFTRQQLTKELNGETGVAMVLNTNFGQSAIVGELKVSNKEIHIFNSYCEQSKDCAQFRLQSKLISAQLTNLNHEATVEVDLKKFNVPVEFGLQISTKSTQDFVFDHTTNLYLHSSKGKTQYTFQLYAHPHESGIILNLPNRELALITSLNIPKNKLSGAYKLDTSAYLDRKNNPTSKTSLIVNADVRIEDNAGIIDGTAKIIYPGQTKDLTLKSKVHFGGNNLIDAKIDIDLFAKKAQQINIFLKLLKTQISDGYNITGALEIKSSGRQFHIEANEHFAFSPKEIGYGSIWSYTVNKKTKTIGVIFSTNFKEAHLYLKGVPNIEIVANSRVVFGELAEVNADLFENQEKKKLFNILVHLDNEKFFKPDFFYNTDAFASAVESYRNGIVESIKDVTDITENICKEVKVELTDLIDRLIKSEPTLQQLAKYYKEFYPSIEASLKKVFRVVFDVIEAATQLGFTYFKAILNTFNAHQKEIKDVVVVASGLVQDIAKIIFKGIGQIEKDIKEFVALLIQQLKALPIFEFIKEQYAQIADFHVPEAILASVDGFFKSVKSILPTEELKDFLTVAYDYIIKHVKREKVDDATEVKRIYSHAISAAQSVLKLLQSSATIDNLFNFVEKRIPIDLSFLKNLPGIGTVKISLLTLLHNGEVPTLSDIYYAYRPTLRLADIVPPFSMTGSVADGGHFFTFDGRHVFLPGTCEYIIAQDIQDGNFSIVGTLASGNLVKITITEPSSESITIKANGNILVNDQPADFPAHTKNLHAFLTNSLVNVKSDYGVHVICGEKAPMICSIHVSGFYLGKLRGLLGDGNNEPYDDFTLPSGKITESDTVFGNAYKLNSGCDAVTVDDKAVQNSPICTEYFSGNSPMGSCFNYVNPTRFRHACDHAVAAGTPEGPCLIAVAYYVACAEARAFISIPPKCGSCKVGNQNIDIGDNFSVKIPNKRADVVFVVEQDTKNERVFNELVIPLMDSLRTELRHKGITDVHIALLGYGAQLKWPQYFTKSGSRNIDHGVNNMKFEKNEPLVTFEVAKEKSTPLKTKLKYLKERLDIELGTFKLTDAYEEVIRYPFRADATKTVIGVIAAPCEKSPLPISLQQVRLLWGQKVYRDLGLTYHHISPLDNLLVSGKSQKNVVGFDHDSAYTFADSKSKKLDGNAELKSNLYDASNDVCAGFAASSGGAAFSSHNFLEGKENQKKQFIQVAVRRVADSLLNVELEEDCSCYMHFGVEPRTTCKVVNRKEREPLARHTKGGVKG